MKDILIIVIPILVLIYVLILFVQNRKLENKINRTLGKGRYKCIV